MIWEASLMQDLGKIWEKPFKPGELRNLILVVDVLGHCAFWRAGPAQEPAQDRFCELQTSRGRTFRSSYGPLDMWLIVVL